MAEITNCDMENHVEAIYKETEKIAIAVIFLCYTYFGPSQMTKIMCFHFLPPEFLVLLTEPIATCEIWWHRRDCSHLSCVYPGLYGISNTEMEK